MKENVLIIGSGAIGKALADVLETKNIPISFWDKDASKVPSQKPIKDLARTADFVFLCVPSGATGEAAGQIAPFLAKEAAVSSLAKGLEAGSGRTMDEVLKGALSPGQSFGLLAGPMLAEELSKGMRGMAVCAAGAAVQKRTAQLFDGTRLFVECSDDLRGVALSGVLKNIYAFGLGIADGLHWGLNGRGWLAAKAATEMARIVPLLGGRETTALGTAGIGDLIATGYSPYSRNHEAGRTLAQAGELGTSEGIASLPLLARKLSELEALPLLSVLYRIVAQRENVRAVFESLVRP